MPEYFDKKYRGFTYKFHFSSPKFPLKKNKQGMNVN